jgi:hypothetical protein
MTSYKSWMTDCVEIHGRTLAQICLPASHDSGTYALTDTVTSDPSPELAAILNKLTSIQHDIEDIPGISKAIPDPAAWITDAAIPAIRGVSAATSRTVLEQLNDGIRCLDLRVYYNAADAGFYTYHGLEGVLITTVLVDVVCFLSSTRGEIVYVTMGHWAGFSESSQYDAFSKLVKQRLGGRAYVRYMSNGRYTNNPFDQTYNDIVSQSGSVQSTVILVNGRSDDCVFWPSEFSPPDNVGNSDVLAGLYTDTHDLEPMIAAQAQQFLAARSAGLPFALYMTLTPQEDDAVDIVVASLASAIAKFATSLLLIPWLALLAVPLYAVATGLAIYGATLSWTTLRELSRRIGAVLQSELTSTFQPLDTTTNSVSFLYVDWYETTNVVDIAIQYSGGVLTGGSRMSSVIGAVNLHNENLELFGVAPSNALNHTYYGPQGWTGGWVADFSGATFEAVSVTVAQNPVPGNVEVFALDANGTIWHNWYSAASAGWQTAWDNAFEHAPAPTSVASLLATTNALTQGVELYAIDADGTLWRNDYAGNEWNGWTASFNDAPAMVQSVAGVTNPQSQTYQLFAIDTTGMLWQTQCDASGTWQSGWAMSFDDAPADIASVFAITNTRSGALELFAIDSSGNLWHDWLDAANVWHGWTNEFDGAPAGAQSVFAVNNINSDNLELFVVDGRGCLWHDWYDGNWNGWLPNFNGAPTLSSVYGISNERSDSLELYGIDQNDVLWHCWYGQDGNGTNGWQPWTC